MKDPGLQTQRIDELENTGNEYEQRDRGSAKVRGETQPGAMRKLWPL
jgi:hypothetical protein